LFPDISVLVTGGADGRGQRPATKLNNPDIPEQPRSAKSGSTSREAAGAPIAPRATGVAGRSKDRCGPLFSVAAQKEMSGG
jgi:hypothetical protein